MLPPLVDGCLPVLVGEPHHSHEPRSPYRCGCLGLVERFGGDKPRTQLLRKYLEFRRRLRAQLKHDSWQWVSGSLLEMDRTPNDLDVIVWLSVLEDDLPLPDFDHDRLHDEEKLHVFFLPYDDQPRINLAHSAYWYELWTSRRGGGRKGFIEIDSAEDETDALRHLERP